MPRLTECSNIAQYLIASFSILCNLLSLIGNVLLFRTIWRTKALHTNLNLLALSVTAVDILSALSSQPMDTVYVINYPNNAFSLIGYIIWESISYSYITTSAYSLCAINLDRLISVCYPLRYHALITRKVINIVISACWLYGFATFALISYLQYSEFSTHYKSIRFDQTHLITKHWLLLIFVINVRLPILISFLASVYITRVARGHRKQIAKLDKKFTLSTTDSYDNSRLTFQALSHPTGSHGSPTMVEKHVWSEELTLYNKLQYNEMEQNISICCSCQWKKEQPGFRKAQNDHITDKEERSGEEEPNQESIGTCSTAVVSKGSLLLHIRQPFPAHNRTRLKMEASRRHYIVVAMKTLRLVLSLSLTFITCTLPYFLMELFQRYHMSYIPCSFGLTRIVLGRMTYLNSVINIMFYVAMNKELKKELKRKFIPWFD